MSARDDILAAVRRAGAPPVPLPVLPQGYLRGDLAELFADALGAAGGQVICTDDPADALAQAYPDAARIASAAPTRVTGNVDLSQIRDPRAYADVDLFLCEAELGVAENGAVWLPESRMRHRAAPFLSPHVAIVLRRDRLFATMHDAYQRTAIAAEGFGVYVAGPSKTADIEQSLVVGAHGPLSLTVLLVDAP